MSTKIKGDFVALYHWTYYERGHVVLGRSEASVLRVMGSPKFDPEKITGAERIRIVRPSPEDAYRARVEWDKIHLADFRRVLGYAVHRLVELGGKYPPGFSRCEKYVSRDGEDTARDGRERHWDCARCLDGVRISRWVVLKTYENVLRGASLPSYKKWEPTPLMRFSEDLPIADPSLPIHAMRENPGHHSSGTTSLQIDPKEVFNYREGGTIFWFQAIEDLPALKARAEAEIKKKKEARKKTEKAEKRRFKNTQQTRDQKERKELADFFGSLPFSPLTPSERFAPMKRFYVHNVRAGFATNSSSTHSIVYLRGARLTPSDEGGDYFGWEDFTLTNQESKREYLAGQIYSALESTSGPEIAKTVARAWTGLSPGDCRPSDHQSVLSLPMAWDGKGLDREFINEFREFLDRDDVAVLGGNDNSENHSDLDVPGVVDAGVRSAFETDGPREPPIVARRDPKGFWTLFNREDGSKMRISFGDNGLKSTPEKATNPELCDLKITDQCNFGCTWCYQGSTPEGKHASREEIGAIARALGELHVFEVALGGGEPTEHPNFESILYDFKYHNIVVNFTTKSLSWLKEPGTGRTILSKIGAFAYSVGTAADVRKLATAMKKYPEFKEKATVQHVVGTSASEDDFRKLLEACHKNEFRLTLLGYKTTGRGLMYQPKPLNWMGVLADIAPKKYLNVGVDTVLVDRHWDEMIAAGVPEWCLTRKEGAFSCYIDAVERKMGPSSFCDPNQYTTLPLRNSNQWSPGQVDSVDIAQIFSTY